MEYDIWDQVKLNVRINSNDEAPVFTQVDVVVVAIDARFAYNEFVCYIENPDKVPLKSSLAPYRLTDQIIKKHNIDKKFLNDWACNINGFTPIIKRVSAPKGAKCGRCKEFIIGTYTTLGEAYRCRSCRLNPYRLTNKGPQRGPFLYAMIFAASKCMPSLRSLK